MYKVTIKKLNPEAASYGEWETVYEQQFEQLNINEAVVTLINESHPKCGDCGAEAFFHLEEHDTPEPEIPKGIPYIIHTPQQEELPHNNS